MAERSLIQLLSCKPVTDKLAGLSISLDVHGLWLQMTCHNRLPPEMDKSDTCIAKREVVDMYVNIARPESTKMRLGQMAFSERKAKPQGSARYVRTWV